MHVKPVAGVAAVIGTFALAAIVGATMAWRELNAPLDIGPEGLLLTVEDGNAMRHVADRLHSDGALEWPSLMTWYARLNGTATQIKVGEYRFDRGTTSIGLLDKLVRGDVVQYRFTIVEGWRFQEMLEALRDHPAIVSTSLDGAELMARLDKPGVHPEGQFLPDTYRFPRGTEDVAVLSRAHAAMESTLGDLWAERSALSVLQTPYEALVLASIVEKETGLAEERPLIAGVFNRRLARRMKLQTDPTVIYGLGEDFDGDLRRRDLLNDTPYNTYTREGLPPTPIALPGYAALEAAVKPAEGDELYFVATGLGDGSHYFSTTLEEHNSAVDRYLEQSRLGGQ
jgi:UPF0755 protein